MNRSVSTSHRSTARQAALSIAFLALLTACGGSAGEVVADAGVDSSVVAGEAPEFDGCSSSGDIVGYQWQIIETPSNNVEDVGKFLREEGTDCSFTLENVMEVDEVGDWVIELTVEASDGATSSDAVSVTVTES